MVFVNRLYIVYVVFIIMITIEQFKSVVIYNFARMMSSRPPVITTHTQRDCVYFNKLRGEICASVVSECTYANIAKLLHQSTRIEQINSVPHVSRCFIDGKQIPRSTSGVQLIIHGADSTQHICIHKKYQKVCHAYFKLRHFPEFIQSYLKSWLVIQDWYVPKLFTVDNLMGRMASSTAPTAIYTHFVESVEALTDVTS